MDKIQANKDYGDIISILIKLIRNARQLSRDIDELERLKIEIFDDPVRKADVIKHFEISDKYDFSQAQDLYLKFKQLGEFLKSNNFGD